MKIHNVVDANGKQVGRLLAILDRNSAIVSLVVGDVEYYAEVTVDGFQNIANRNVSWESATCGDGQGYFEFPLSADPASMFAIPPLRWSLPGKTVYVADFSAAPAAINFSNGSESSGESCNSIGGDADPIDTLPANPVADLDELYEAPFKFQ